MIRVACAILVDPTGRLLLQLRDGSTINDPHRWGPPGGRVEPGEEPHDAAVRELEEETGLRVARLDFVWSGFVPSRTDSPEFNFYCGATNGGQDEVQGNEGAAMVFADAAPISELNLTQPFSMVVPHFINSAQYTGLCL